MKVISLLLALTMAVAAVPHASLAEGRNVDGIWLDDGEKAEAGGAAAGRAAEA